MFGNNHSHTPPIRQHFEVVGSKTIALKFDWSVSLKC